MHISYYIKVLFIIVFVYVSIKVLIVNQDLQINDNITNLDDHTLNINKKYEEKKKFTEMNIKNQLKRKQIIHKFCESNEEEKERKYGVIRRLIVDKKEEITWCPICKAGSSTWMKIFAVLGGEMDPAQKLPNPNIQVSKLAKKAFPFLGYIPTMRAINTTTKFLIVRHPFERLLSAFRDKLEDTSKTYYKNKFGKYIMDWYRKDEDDNAAPTFEEFLTYIVMEKSFDEHWNPYHIECAPCFVNYDYVLKMETFENDHKYLIESLGIPEIELIQKINKWDNTNRYGRTDNNIKRKYYSQIPFKLLKSIYDIYKFDFLLFDYDPNEYFAMTKNYPNNN